MMLDKHLSGRLEMKIVYFHFSKISMRNFKTFKLLSKPSERAVLVKKFGSGAHNACM